MPIPSFYHIITFYYRAYAGTTDRVRPDDMTINGYYFGVKYLCPGDNQWYYKTTAYPLTNKQNESLAQAVTIDVEISSPGVFVDAPYGIGTVHYELVVCSSSQTTWSTTVPGTIILLTGETINGVTYHNSGSFTILGFINSNNNDLWFGNSEGSGDYQYCLISSSSDWEIDSKTAWISTATYTASSGGTDVTSSPPWASGRYLRIWPGSVNTGNNRSGTVRLQLNSDTSVQKVINVNQYGHNPVIDSWQFEGSITGTAGTVNNFVVGSTNPQIVFTPNYTGTVWCRLWCTTHSYFGDWVETTVTSGNQKTLNLTGVVSSDIHYGGNYSVYVTTNNPNA